MNMNSRPPDKEVNSEPDKEPQKKCISCRRSLLVRCFGICRSAKDGYFPQCRDCAGYMQKKSYRKKAPLDAGIHQTPLVIYPMRENNRLLLSRSMLKGDGLRLIRGTSMDDHSGYCLAWDDRGFRLWKVFRPMQRLRLPAEDKVLITGIQMTPGSHGRLIELIMEELIRFEVRLHESVDLDI